MSIRKVMIVGWDGATWDYIDPLIAQGKLPNLQKLLKSGAHGTLQSTIPPFTHIAWPSLVTGSGPDSTGVFDGVHFQRNSYHASPAHGFRGVPIWTWMNYQQKRSGVLNVPMTYPTRNIDGYIVSGFDSPASSPDIAYPRDLFARWNSAGMEYNTLARETVLMDQQNPHQKRRDLDAFTRDWVSITKDQGETVKWLWEHSPVDFMFIVFSGTDSINHRTNDFSKISEVYQAADAALGRIMDTVGEETLLCIVSDHGSTRAKRYISLNSIFSKMGWLAFHPRIATRHLQKLPAPIRRVAITLWSQFPNWIKTILSKPLILIQPRLAVAIDNIDFTRTKCFARTSMGPVYVNSANVFPDGTLSQEETEAFTENAIKKLAALTDTDGQPLFGKFHLKTSLYPDTPPGLPVPEFVMEPHNWSDHMITGFPQDPFVRPIQAAGEYGTHTSEGILVLSGPGIRQEDHRGRYRIEDVAPTVLAAWGLPIPDIMTGRPLIELLDSPPVITRASVPAELIQGESHNDTHAHDDEIIERLAALGYLE